MSEDWKAERERREQEHIARIDNYATALLAHTRLHTAEIRFAKVAADMPTEHRATLHYVIEHIRAMVRRERFEEIGVANMLQEMAENGMQPGLDVKRREGYWEIEEYVVSVRTWRGYYTPDEEHERQEYRATDLEPAVRAAYDEYRYDVTVELRSEGGFCPMCGSDEYSAPMELEPGQDEAELDIVRCGYCGYRDDEHEDAQPGVTFRPIGSKGACDTWDDYSAD